MPETCEKCLGLDLAGAFTMPTGPMKFTSYCLTPWFSKLPWSQTVFSKCRFTWNKGPVDILNECRAQNELVRQTCKYFSWFFYTALVSDIWFLVKILQCCKWAKLKFARQKVWIIEHTSLHTCSKIWCKWLAQSYWCLTNIIYHTKCKVIKFVNVIARR